MSNENLTGGMPSPFDNLTQTERTISGSVQPDGTVKAGTGFTVLRQSPGDYSINFNTPFNQRPVVVATQRHPHTDDFNQYGGDTRDNLVIIAVSNSKCKLKVGNGDGKVCDRAFEFIAIGQ